MGQRIPQRRHVARKESACLRERDVDLWFVICLISRDMISFLRLQICTNPCFDFVLASISGFPTSERDVFRMVQLERTASYL